jgi:hypothetical protein
MPYEKPKAFSARTKCMYYTASSERMAAQNSMLPV